VAAAIVLALVGPAWRDNAPANPDDALLATVAAVEPSEDDLLPSLGEQYTRYRNVADHVGSMQGVDGDSQRLLLRAELEHAGLPRRNAWLSSQLGSLPLERRREYQRFLDGLDNALDIIDRELAESAAEHRAVNVGLVQGALDGVKAPQRLTVEVRCEVRRRDKSGVMNVSPGPDLNPELAAYAAVRAAVYANDPERIVAACDAYLRPYGKAGKFARPAVITMVGSLVRLDRAEEAAARYEQIFGLYEEKLTPDDWRMIERTMTAEEREKLRQGRRSLHGE